MLVNTVPDTDDLVLQLSLVDHATCAVLLGCIARQPPLAVGSNVLGGSVNWRSWFERRVGWTNGSPDTICQGLGKV